MSTSFETRVREDLRTAADHAAYPAIDPAAVIGEGTRVVRRRHRLQGLGAAAAVAAIAVGGVLATHAGRSTTAPPAGPSTSQGARVAEAVLNVTHPRNQQFTVSVAPDGRVAYHVVDLSSGRRTALAEGRVPASGFTWGSWGAAPGVVLAVLPEQAIFGDPVVQPLNEQPFQVSFAPLRGTPYKAVAVVFERASDAKGFRGMVWQTPDGAMHGPRGAVAAARFPSASSPGSPSSVWADPSVGAYGLNAMGPISQQPLPSGGLAVHTTIATDGEHEVTTVFGVAPEGSTGLRATFRDGYAAELRAKGLTGTDLVAFHAEVRRSPGAGPLLTVTWKDSSGVSHALPDVDR
jgi:hypothetical protein